MLKLDSNVHSSEKDISHSDTDTDRDKDGNTDSDNTQWTDSTHYQPWVPVVHRFIGLQEDYKKRRHPIHKRRNSTYGLMLFLLGTMPKSWWKRHTDIITIT